MIVSAAVDETTISFEKLITSESNSGNIFEKLTTINADTIMAFVEEKWKKCVEEKAILVPLYPSEIVVELCYRIIGSWIRIELYFEKGTVCKVEHPFPLVKIS